MISPIYARQILNALFRTTGAEGSLTAVTELADLLKKYSLSSFDITVTEKGVEKKITVYGKSADDYFDAYVDDKYSVGKNTTDLENMKNKVNGEKKQWYHIATYSESFQDDKMNQPKNFTGWYLEKSKVQSPPYPAQKKVYLGLFTTMPDGEGKNYVEPTADEYMRVNLHESIVTGEPTIGLAAEDDTGKTAIVNSEIIMFPEIISSSWGEIKGFGIFENQTPVTDEIPILWGVLKTKVSNEGEDDKYEPTTVPTNVNHVPLFRKKEFSVSLG